VATIIDADAVRWTHSRARKYPWDEWLDGQARRLHRGDDFNCSLVSMRGLTHQVARRRGLAVRTKVEDDNCLLIQAQKKEVRDVR